MFVPLPTFLPGYAVPLIYLFAGDGWVKIGRTQHLSQRAGSYKDMTCLAYVTVLDTVKAERALIQHFKTRFVPDYPVKRHAPPERFRASDIEAYEHFTRFALMLEPSGHDIEKLIRDSQRKVSARVITKRSKEPKLSINHLKLSVPSSWNYAKFVNESYSQDLDESDPFLSKRAVFRKHTKKRHNNPYSFLEPYGEASLRNQCES